MSRLAGDMKGFVVLGVYRSTVKKGNKENNTAMGGEDFYCICTQCNTTIHFHYINDYYFRS